MKKKIFGALLALVCVITCTILVAPARSKAAAASPADEAQIEVGVKSARFLNILNHNYVYGYDFDDAETIINDSVCALLANRDAENPEYIDEIFVKSFVNDMYGVALEDITTVNSAFPQKDGYVYIIPKGITKYEHKMVSATENEDGTFTVVTDVTVVSHDAPAATYKCVSLFAVNSESSLGYNIISSDIITESAEV